MRAIYFVVEGQTEQEFVHTSIRPYLFEKGITDVRGILIETSPGHKGGFVNYAHLKKLLIRLLKEETDILVSTFVDFYRIPNDIPNYYHSMSKALVDDKITCLNQSIWSDINSVTDASRLEVYFQKHEFEALLFAENTGFESYYDENIYNQTAKIINQFPNPEEINDNPLTAPSKRILQIMPSYDKVIDGNIIALEVGFDNILQRCPRFRVWLDTLETKFSAP
jgi:hypothetical protein